jgi:hypothetical protein
MLQIAYSATAPMTFVEFFQALDLAGAGSTSGRLGDVTTI